MDSLLSEKKLYYQRVIDIWEGFCQLHKELFELTCEEYITLLASDLEKLESMIPLKEEIIQKIGDLETERGELVEQINSRNIFATRILKAGDLLTSFSELDQAHGLPALRNLNSLLIDIVEKIQDQNKKNQMFLNKAMASLREVKQGFSGKKTYTTYGADGMARALGR